MIEGGKGVADRASELPIVFCHGLGIGNLLYITFIQELVRRAPSRRVLLVELPHISMRPVEVQASPKELVTCILDMLAAHNCMGGVHFVGHSFGSVVLAWVVRQAPSVCCLLTFMDPVCFLLCKHDVAYNFLYADDKNPEQAMMHWFVARELYIAHTLSRRFWWHDNILFPEQLPCPTAVVLSGADFIVPSHAVRQHLSSFESRRRRQEADGHAPVRVVWLEGVGHAGFLMDPETQAAMVQLITRPLECIA